MKGLLWFDNDTDRSLVDKVSQATARYQQKFGLRPTHCFVNEVDFDGQTQEVNGVQLIGVANVLRHHFLVGVTDNGQQASGP
jgi:hypothetical protein